ncbi:CU044_5270 family protein [Planotetraspora phitsanulokensis]|nr:CU044_5270 family protein [Planotetraspora phitsanulokensis]
MSTDEITTFRAARPEATPYDPGARARLRARLIQESTAVPHARPLRSWTVSRRIMAVGALTAALVAGITVVQNIDLSGRPTGGHAAPGESRRPLLLGPVANAEDLAQAAAQQAAAEPDVRPRPDQWSYAKTVLAMSSKGTGGSLFGPPDRRLTVEQWRRADGKQSAAIENGKLEIHDLGSLELSASPRSDYPYLLSLPDDADALLDHVYKVVDEESGGEKESEQERADRAFQIIEVYMRDSALPSKLRAAMYGALAKIPGVRYEGKAADIQGRPGVTLYRIVEGYLRSEIIVNPKTYEYMGFRFIAVKNHVSAGLDMSLHTKKGQILGWGGLIKAAVVDKPGQRA